MVASNSHGWRRAVSAFLGRTGPSCVRIELSIGARAAELLGGWDCDEGHGSELADEVTGYMADLQAAQSTPVTYTLRARRPNGDPIASVGVHVPLARESDEGPHAGASGGDRAIVATLVKHVEQSHTLLVKLSAEQASTLGSLLATQRAALDTLGQENAQLRTQLREAQAIAGESLDELNKRDRAMAELQGSDKRWARVVQLVLSEVDKRTGGKATAHVKGGVGAMVAAVASELAAREHAGPSPEHTNGAAAAELPNGATAAQLTEGKPS